MAGRIAPYDGMRQRGPACVEPGVNTGGDPWEERQRRPSWPEGVSGGCRTSSASAPASLPPGSATPAATSPMPPTGTTATTPRPSRSSSTRTRPPTVTCSSSSSRSTTRPRVNRQGNDIGASYRSAIFTLNDEQRRVAEDTIADVDASGLWPGKVVTEVTPAGSVLGGRTRAPGLPRALPQRLHLPLPPPRMGPASSEGLRRRLARPAAPGAGP